MTAQELMANSVEMISGNMAYNLDFIPDDKLNWKPAPEANSALEVATHATWALNSMTGDLLGQPSEQQGPPTTPFASRDAAKGELVQAGQRYAMCMREITDADMERTIPHQYFGEITVGKLAPIPMMDLTHHHGQIAYIQTLLGDTESHFMPGLI